MTGVKIWLCTAAGFVAFVVFALVGRESAVFASFWVMVAMLWFLFGWFVSTVVSRRRAKREDQE